MEKEELKETLEKKKSALRKLQVQVQNLEDRFWKKKEMPRLESLVGTVWRYTNRYSGPSEPWFLYQRIVRVATHGTVYVDWFQIDCNGELQVRKNESKAAHYFRERGTEEDSWIRVTKKEWNKAAARALKLVEGLPQ